METKELEMIVSGRKTLLLELTQEEAMALYAYIALGEAVGASGLISSLAKRDDSVGTMAAGALMMLGKAVVRSDLEKMTDAEFMANINASRELLAGVSEKLVGWLTPLHRAQARSRAKLEPSTEPSAA